MLFGNRRSLLTPQFRLGPELVPNPDFSNNGSGWQVANSDATHIVTFANNTARYQSDTTSPSLTLFYPSIYTAGKRYITSATVTVFVSGSGVKSEHANQALNLQRVGTFWMLITATSTSLAFVRLGPNIDLTLSYASVRQVL